MTMMTLGLGEASSRPAARRRPPPAATRPHQWGKDSRCVRCAMHRTWDGAALACTGIDKLDARSRGGKGR